MTWLTPITGLLVAAAVIPPLLLLYFLKLRRRRQWTASTLLWQRAVEDLQANAPFQRLRRSLLLLLQLIVLLLLAASVAQPRLHAGTHRGGRVVLMVDNSASMSATDVDAGTRLEAAKRQARERIETLYGGGLFSDSPGETMVIAFSDRAEIMTRFTSSKAQLLAAVDRIGPTDGETSIAQALKLARASTTNFVNELGEARIVGEPPALELYSDGAIRDLDEQVLRGEALQYFATGGDGSDNVGVTSISVERPFDRPTSVQVFAAVANFGDEPVACDLQLSVDGAAIGIEEVSIDPAGHDPATGMRLPGRRNIVFSPFEQPRGAVIEVANLRPDLLAADDAAHVIVPPPKRLDVLLVAPRGELLRVALEGMALERLERVRSADRLASLAEEGALESFDVVVLDGVTPASLPPGRYLVFGPPPPVEGLNPYGEGEDQVALEWREDHPAMAHLAFDNLFVQKFHLVQPADDARVIVEGSRGPLLVELTRGPVRVLYCPFDPMDSNWPFQRSFINFLVNSIDYLGHAGDAITSRSYAPGEALSARLPQSARDIELRLPDETDVPLESLDPTAWSWGPTRRAGVHLLSWDESGADERRVRAFAVNLLSDTEGDVRVVPQIVIGQEAVAGRDAGDASYTPLWPWALGLALVVMMGEWWMYHRKMMI